MKEEEALWLKSQIRQGRLQEVEQWLHKALTECPADDQLYFWMGNLERQRNNFPRALEHYATAMEMNAESPAREAHGMLMDILRFYDVDRYNG